MNSQAIHATVRVSQTHRSRVWNGDLLITVRTDVLVWSGALTGDHYPQAQFKELGQNCAGAECLFAFTDFCYF